VTIDLDIKHNEIIVRKNALYRYAMEMPQQRMLFMPVDPDHGAEFICTATKFGELLKDREIRAHTVIRDHNGEIIADGDKDLDPAKENSKKVNDAGSLFFFLKKWHQNPTSLHHARLDDCRRACRRGAQARSYLVAELRRHASSHQQVPRYRATDSPLSHIEFGQDHASALAPRDCRNSGKDHRLALGGRHQWSASVRFRR
jgi:hypothetical protein